MKELLSALRLLKVNRKKDFLRTKQIKFFAALSEWKTF